MKVVQEINVDNVTIVINDENKLEAKIPTSTSTAVEIEEVTGITNFYDGAGSNVDTPFMFDKDGQRYAITKVGRVKNTDWLVFKAEVSSGSSTGGSGNTGGETTTSLPTFNVSSRGNYNEFSVQGNTIANSEGHVYFEFDTDMEAYADAGYKVYGVVKNAGTVLYEAPLPDADQVSALSSSDVQNSELAHGWLQGIVGKTLNSTILTAHVYLMNDAGNKVYPANKPDGFVATLQVRVEFEVPELE